METDNFGDNTTNDSHLPIQVKGLGGAGVLTDIAQVGAGSYTSYAVAKDGTVWSWGTNGNGQLGDGTGEQRHTPVQVIGDAEGAIEIYVMSDSAAVLKGDGTVYAWGYNGYGQLGQIIQADKPYPVQVQGVSGVGYLENIEQIAVGNYHIVALNSNNEMYGWGHGELNELTNTTENKVVPVRINSELTDIKYIRSRSI